MKEKKEEKETLYEKLTPFRAAAKYTQIPFTLLACTIVGYLIGNYIEGKVKSGGIVLAIFIFLGVAAGFREVILLTKGMDEETKRIEEKKDDEGKS